MRRRVSLLLALAALLAALAVADGSGADFAATSTNAASTFSTAADWTLPALTVTAPADGASVNTRTPALRGAAGTATNDLPTVTARIYAGTTPTGTPLQTLTATASAGAWTATPTALAEGAYLARVTQSDKAGNTATIDSRFTVDTVAPTPVMIGAANGGGGTAGRLNAGDVISYRFSEAIDPATVLAGFAGGSTTADVRVRFVDNGATDYFLVLDSSGGFTTHLDQFVATNSQLVTAQVVSWPATLRQSADGTTFTVTLGTAPSSGLSSTVNTSHGMAWTPKSGPRDRAGNALVVPGSPITETDGDVDF